MRWIEHKIPPPVVAGIIGSLMWMVSTFAPALPIESSVRQIGAAILATLGIGFDALGLYAFYRARTTPNPMHPDRTSTLVTRGVYRISRNPMYLGLLLLLIAWAVDLSGLWAFLGPILFVQYINCFQIEPEERVMNRKFGPEYACYAERVRRWL